MSDLAYTVAVIENSHEIWEQLLEHQHLLGEEGRQIWEGEQEELLTKKTPKFTKRAGKKRASETRFLSIVNINIIARYLITIQ